MPPLIFESRKAAPLHGNDLSKWRGSLRVENELAETSHAWGRGSLGCLRQKKIESYKS